MCQLARANTIAALRRIFAAIGTDPSGNYPLLRAAAGPADQFSGNIIWPAMSETPEPVAARMAFPLADDLP